MLITPEMVERALENPNMQKLFLPWLFIPAYCIEDSEQDQQDQPAEESEDQGQ